MFKISSNFINRNGSVQKTQQANISHTNPLIGTNSKDVFVKSEPKITYELTNEGKPALKLVESGNKSEIQTLKGEPLYTCVKNNGNMLEIVYSSTGKKLYELQTLQTNERIKTIYGEDGETVESVVVFDKDKNVKFKNVLKVDNTNLDKENLSNLPEYFYHFTNVDNYKAMKEKGFIKTSSDSSLKKSGNSAVFLVESDNLLNQWDSLKNGTRNSYLTKLLKYCDKNHSNEIVMLKIPTSKLNINKLAYRNQDTVLESFPMFSLPPKEKSEYFAFSRLMVKLHENTSNFMDEISNDVFLTDRMKHLQNGSCLSELKDYSSFPVEILCKENIPFDVVEDAKVIDISQIQDMYLYDKKAEKISKELVKNAL